MVHKRIKRAFISAVLVAVFGTATVANSNRVYAANDDESSTSATSEATVEFTGGLSLVAVPNLDFGTAHTIDGYTNQYNLFSNEDATNAYGRSVVVKNDGGYSGWSVTAGYKDFSYYAGVGSNVPTGSTIKNSFIDMTNTDSNYFEKQADDGTWSHLDANTNGFTLSLPSGMVQGSTMPILGMADTSDTGTYRLNFPDKNSAVMTVPVSEQHTGVARAVINWSLTGSPTS